MRHDDSKYAEFKVSDLFDVKYDVNLELNERDWKEFKVKELFNVELSKGDIKFDEMDSGDVPLVSSGETNNGIVGYIDSRGDGKAEIFPSNRITLDMFGNAFYQDEPFYAVSHGRVNILNSKFELTRNIGLFISAVIKQEQYKYSYGRAIYSGVAENMVIKLPVMSDGGPDWQFMEDYIKSLHHKPLTTKNNFENTIALNVEKWKEFRFGDLISNIYKAKAINKDDLIVAVDETDSIRYITRTAEDNGCELLAVRSELPANIVESGNAISIGDTTATCFYQDEEFITGDHMVVVRADSWLNKYTGLFVVAIILHGEQYKYSYGRAYLMDRIKDTIVKLPADDNGNPDWQFMENYIKSLPYGDRLEG